MTGLAVRVRGRACSDLWTPATLSPLAADTARSCRRRRAVGEFCLFDLLPTIEERIPLRRGQHSVALVRALLVAGGAWLTADMGMNLSLLLATVVLKVALLVGYIGRFHGWGRPWFRAAVFGDQIGYTAPFGLSSACYVLRSQADQWVAATLFTLHSFASFSIAAILGQLVNIFRTSVVEAFMPSMSRLEAAGELKSMMEMNARANAMVAMLLLPMLGFVFAFAPEIVSLVYTAAYLDAGTVMRVYTLGLSALVVELSSVMQLRRQGMFTLGANLVVLGISVPISWFGGVHLGLAGAAAGSVSALYLDRAIVLRRIAAIRGYRCARSSTGERSRARSPGARRRRWSPGSRCTGCSPTRRSSCGWRAALAVMALVYVPGISGCAREDPVRHRLAGAWRRRAPGDHARQPARRARPRVPPVYVKNDPSPALAPAAAGALDGALPARRSANSISARSRTCTRPASASRPRWCSRPTRTR